MIASSKDSSFDELLGGGRGRRDDDVVTVGRQVLPEQRRHVRLVVDDENPAGLARFGVEAGRRPGAQRRTLVQKARDVRREGFLVDGLGDETVAARGEGPFPIPVHRVGGDREDRDLRRGRVRADLPRRLPAREQRQREVHEHEVGPRAPGGLDGGPSVGHRRDLVPFRLEQELDECPDVGRVFGDQDAGHRCRGPPGRYAAGADSPRLASTSRTSLPMSAPFRRMRWADPFRRA